jgi:hypothetical protein
MYKTIAEAIANRTSIDQCVVKEGDMFRCVCFSAEFVTKHFCNLFREVVQILQPMGELSNLSIGEGGKVKTQTTRNWQQYYKSNSPSITNKINL